MRVIDEKKGIAVCGKDEIPNWILKKDEVAFFYHRGLIVLVEGCHNFEAYKELIPLFLELPDQIVPDILKEALKVNETVCKAFLVLVQIKRFRRKRRWHAAV